MKNFIPILGMFIAKYPIKKFIYNFLSPSILIKKFDF